MRPALSLFAVLAGTLSVYGQAPPKLRLAEVEDIAPKGYRAELTLDPGKATFSGSVAITMDIAKGTGVIWLNQERITIQSAVLKTAGKELKAQIVPGGDDFVGLHFDAPVGPGSAVVTIQYHGVVEEKNSSGIFHRTVNGDSYLLTQFEQIDARAAFPCFDEPSYKTPWQLTLHVPAKDSAVSNTPIASETAAAGMKTVVFRETKPLPSYLVAFGVGPFEYVSAGVAGRNKVPVRIVVPKGKSGEAKYAAEVTATILTRLEDYFGIPYPYEKADQVALPDTAGFGAMENAGMVTYEENLILADPKIDTINRQRTYATIAAHELSHQWFGDLVTTAWWNDIWLNEAFATWMERKITAEWKPEWQSRVADVGSILRAEREDSLISARKIRQEITSKDDINNAFDDITYEKGATVIGMFENWMGAEEFRKGVQSYLKQYAFRATTAAEFLDSLSSSSRQNVTKAFSTFLNQAGLPLVSVALDCTKAKPTLKVQQERFLPLGSKGDSKQVWNIPLCVRYGTGTSGQSQCALITQPAETVELTAAGSCPSWVEANDKAAGYYRVQYQGGLLASLTAGDVKTRLTAPERAEFMGNAEALSRAGKLATSDALGLVEIFHADSDRYVTQSALNLAFAPRLHLLPDNLQPNFRRFLLKNFQARARELGWAQKPGDSEDVRLLRVAIVRPVATWGGDEELATQAKVLADKWFTDHSAIAPDMVEPVLLTAAFYGDLALFNRFLGELGKTKDKQIRAALLGAMRQFRDRASIDAGMNALADGKIPFIEGAGLLLGNGQQQESTQMMELNFLKANWDKVVSAMPTQGGFDFGSQLPHVGTNFCDAGSRDQLKAFFEPRVDRFVGARHSLDQVLEGIDLCIAGKAAQAPSVAAFLAKY